MTDQTTIYFDNAATTRPCEAAVAAILAVVREDYANPSSLHRAGYLAEKQREAARDAINALIGNRTGTLLLTSGGTESNNTAIFGAASAPAAKRLEKPNFICSAGEHPSCADAFSHLAAQGTMCAGYRCCRMGGRMRKRSLRWWMRTRRW